jgi:hypothetical protein
MVDWAKLRANYWDGRPRRAGSRRASVRNDLENPQVLLGGRGPVPGLGGAARQAEPRFDVAGILAEHALPLVHRLLVLLGLPEAPGEVEPKRAARTLDGPARARERLPIGTSACSAANRYALIPDSSGRAGHFSRFGAVPYDRGDLIRARNVEGR